MCLELNRSAFTITWMDEGGCIGTDIERVNRSLGFRRSCQGVKIQEAYSLILHAPRPTALDYENPCNKASSNAFQFFNSSILTLIVEYSLSL